MKILSLTAVVLGLAATAHATSTYDLTAVTGGMSTLKDDLVTAAGVVIPYGIALCAILFGGKWVIRVFKGFAK